MIDFDSPLSNTTRKFGEADRYYVAYVKSRGIVAPALFTDIELRDAIQRADKQPEFNLKLPRRNISRVVTALLAFLLGVLITVTGVIVL